MKQSSLAVAAVLLAHTPAYATASRMPFSIPYFGGSAVTGIAARSGEPCSISGVTGGASTISSVEVSAPPRNGSATVGQGYAVWYRSQPGFTGADAFEFTMSVTSEGRPGTSTVRVHVTVQ